MNLQFCLPPSPAGSGDADLRDFQRLISVDQRALLDFMLSPDTAVELQTEKYPEISVCTVSVYEYGKLYGRGTGV